MFVPLLTIAASPKALRLPCQWRAAFAGILPAVSVVYGREKGGGVCQGGVGQSEGSGKGEGGGLGRVGL